MNSEDIRTQHEALKTSITQETVLEIELADDPDIATDMVLQRTPAEACALIDKMIPVAAAFVLLVLRQRAKGGNDSAQSIVTLAETLQIRGVKGLVHARDETYRLTGVFIV